MRRMRRLLGGFFCACLFISAVNHTAAQSKIGYVDSQKILSTFPEALDAQQKLDAENQKWEQELSKLNDGFKALQEQLDQQSLLLSQAKRNEKQQEVQAAAKEIQEFQDQKWGERGEFFKRREELMRPVIEKINQVIHRVAEEEEYDFIFDSVAGNILHADEKHDLTDKVLEELEKETPAAAPTSQRN